MKVSLGLAGNTYCTLFLFLLAIAPFTLPQSLKNKSPTVAHLSSTGSELLTSLENNKLSECMKTALTDLVTNCAQMSHNQQMKMGISMASCHLVASGKKGIRCKQEESISSCTSKLEGIHWSAYSQFFTHSESICFYYESTRWQEKTAGAVSMLTEYSLQLSNLLLENANNLEAINQGQREIISQMEASAVLATQTITGLKNISESQNTLGAQIEEGHRKMITSLSESEKEVEGILSGISSKITYLMDIQEWILGEVVDFKTLFFYSVLAMCIIMTTSWKRTYSARYPLLFISMGSYSVELQMASSLPDPSSLISRFLFYFTSSPIIYTDWGRVQRFFLIMFIVLVEIYQIGSYRDLNNINNRLLNNIEGRVQIMQESTPYWVKKYLQGARDEGPKREMGGTCRHKLSFLDHPKHLLHTIPEEISTKCISNTEAEIRRIKGSYMGWGSKSRTTTKHRLPGLLYVTPLHSRQNTLVITQSSQVPQPTRRQTIHFTPY